MYRRIFIGLPRLPEWAFVRSRGLCPGAGTPYPRKPQPACTRACTKSCSLRLSKVDYVSYRYMTRPGPKLTDRPLIGDEQDEPAGRRPPAPRAMGHPRGPGLLGSQPAVRGSAVACQGRSDDAQINERAIHRWTTLGGPMRRSNCVASLAAGRELVVISRGGSWMRRKIASFSGRCTLVAGHLHLDSAVGSSKRSVKLKSPMIMLHPWRRT